MGNKYDGFEQRDCGFCDECKNCSYCVVSYYEHDTGYKELDCEHIKEFGYCVHDANELKLDDMENKSMNDNGMAINFTINEEHLADAIIAKISDRLEDRVVNHLIGNMTRKINEQLDDFIEDLKGKATMAVSDKLTETVDKIYDDFMLEVPESDAWGAPKKQVPLRQYILDKTKNLLDEACILKKDYCTTKYSVKEYFDQKITDSVVSGAKKEIEKYAADIKKDVSNQLKDTFDIATRGAISQQVFDVLMATDTYKRVADSMKLLAGK